MERTGAISIKVSASYFVDIDTHFILLSNLDNTNEDQFDKLMLPNFKIYFKATVIKEASYCKTNRHIDKWNRIESTNRSEGTSRQKRWSFRF